MPKIEGAPQELNNLLEEVHAQCLRDGGDDQKCSSIAFGAAKAAGWIKNEAGAWEKKDYELMSLQGVEIFSEGVWNGDKYSVSDLKEMEKNFKLLDGKIQPFLKLGHDNQQKIIQNDGLPAAGWISNVYVLGNKLLADFKDVPKKIYDIIKRKAYKRVSSEIYWDFEDGGKKYKRVQKAVALLGGDTPAVTSLADIQALYTAAYSQKEFPFQIKNYNYPEGNNMDEKVAQLEAKFAEMQAMISKMAEQMAKISGEKPEEKKPDDSAAAGEPTEEMKKQQEAVDKLAQENKALTEKINAMEEKGHQKSVEEKLNKLVTEGKMLPAQVEVAKGLYALIGKEKLYSKDGKENDLIVQLFSLNPVAVEFQELSTEGKQYSKDEEKQDLEVSGNIQKSKNYQEAVDAYKGRKK